MIYVFFAHGFEEIEAVGTVDILRRAGLDVRTVGVGAKTITGSHGITIHCDLIDHMAGTKNLEMIVLPGGMPGAVNLEKSGHVQKLIDYAVEKELWIGAICAAPSILGRKGLLDGKTVTCFPGLEEELGQANVTGNRVERDGKLVTAKGAGAVVLFGAKLVECLLDGERADKLVASLQ